MRQNLSGNRRRLVPILLVGIAWLLITSSTSEPADPRKTAHDNANSAKAGSTRSTVNQEYTITDNVNMVLLDVSVQGSKGVYATGLNKSDFQVLEDGKAQTITHFANVDTPVTVGLVVDNSGSMVSKRPEVVTAGLAFGKESNPRDEFFVINFNDYVHRGLGGQAFFSDNIQQLRAALYWGIPSGRTALYDAVAAALKHLELSRQDKRTLIIVSDGGDNVSKTSFPEVVDLMEASRATVYTVGLYDEDDRDRNPDVLKKFAKVTGGQFFQPATLDEVVPVFHRIATDIRNRYSIGYVPDVSEQSAKRNVRSIRVIAKEHDGRKLMVRTRTNYSVTPLSQLMADK